jgi:signal transduction histidine kinase
VSKLKAYALFQALFLTLSARGGFEPAGHWRVYREAEGWPESGFNSLTVSENGNILAVSSATSSFWVFDGYEAKSFPLPDPAAQRVYQSPAGQLWTISPRGLWTMKEGTWTLSSVLSGKFPLCPVRQNVVLCLLPDRLVEANVEDSAHPRLQPLLSSNHVNIGVFAGMTISAADELWIAGEQGLARASGPYRSLSATSQWNAFLPPANLGLHHFQKPEADKTGITTVADSDGGKTVAHFDGAQWETWPCGGKKIRVAWRGPDNIYRAATANALLEIHGAELITNREISSREYFDAAVDSRGICSLATSEGLVRFHLLLWRLGEPDSKTKANLDAAPETVDVNHLSGPMPDIGTNGEIACSLATETGDLWLGGNFGTAWRHDKWTVFPASETGAPRDVRRLMELPTGRIWCASREKIWSFDGKNWSAVRGGINHINGMICERDGSVWVATDGGAQRFFRGNWIENGPDEGLSGEVVRSVAEDQRGGIWAATSDGPELFHPEADSDPPRTFIAKMTDKQKSVPEDGAINIGFSGDDKWHGTPPRRLLFSHRLDEGEWSPFEDGARVSFSDLPAGKHYFQACSMNRAGNVDPDPAHLEFAVVLPWYEEKRLVLIASAGAVVAVFFALLAYKRHRQLLLSYAQVEKQVAERTRELGLANQELLQSEKMRAMGTLAAGIAHDFNNILSIVKGSAQIIEDNLGDAEKIRTRTDRIKTVVDQGSSVVQAMLGFSRGSDDMREPCELNPVVDNTLKLLGDRFLREVDMRFECASDLPRIRASQSLVQQILLNFIFNAAESMNGRKRIVIATSPQGSLPGGMALQPGPAPAYVAVSVRDFGCGVPPENISRVFEPFFTTKAFSTRRGTGLGLSIVYELAKKMEAGLALESAVGQGSVFSLILPAASPEQTKPSTAL